MWTKIKAWFAKRKEFFIGLALGLGSLLGYAIVDSKRDDEREREYRLLVESLRERQSELDGQLEDYADINQQLRQRLTELGQSSDEYREHIAELERVNAELESARRQLSVDLEQARNDLADAHGNLDKIRAEQQRIEALAREYECILNGLREAIERRERED